jgi:PAS domain S-box-containing protein
VQTDDPGTASRLSADDVLNSLAAHIAVLDTQGKILVVNEAWKKFAQDNGGSAEKVLVGADYLAVCRKAAFTQGDDLAAAALDGIQSVLDRQQANFSLEYPCHSLAEERWFNMSVRWLRPPGVGLVVSHENITERKNAELILSRSRAELKSIYDHAPVMMCVVDATRNVLYANPAFTAFAGTPEECLKGGRACGIFGCVNAGEAPEGCGFGEKCKQCALRLALNDTLQTGRRHDDVEHHGVWVREGHPREVAFLASTARIDSGGEAQALLCLHDITERKRFESVLRASESNLRSLFDAVSESVFLIDRHGTVLAANPTFAARVGRSIDSCLGKSIFDLVPAEVALRRRQWVERVRATGQPLTMEDERQGRWMTHSLWPIPGHDGLTDRIVGFAVEVTDRKRGELIMAARLRLLRLAASCPLSELLRATLDEAEALTGSQAGFYHFLEPDQVTLSLQAWSTNTVQHMCSAEGAGLHYPVDKAGVWVDCIRQRRPVIHNDYASLPHRKGLPEGHTPIVRQLVVPVLRGDLIVAVLGVGNKAADYDDPDVAMVSSLADLAWDIAESKRHQEALQASEERFRRIVETANEGVWAMDSEHRTTFVNARMAQMLGFEPAEVLGRKVEDFMFAEDLPGHRQRMKQRHHGRNGNYEHRFRRRDGTEVRTLVAATALTNNKGEFAGSFAMFTDITERKWMEEQLRQAQKMEGIGQLAGGIAHDFNNILAAIMMQLSLLHQETSLDAAAREGLKELQAEAQRAADLVRQLLHFSRRSVLQVRVLDVNHSVENMLRMLRRLIGEHVELCFSASANLPAVEADAALLEQVLMNLCVNGRDAMPNGGRLTISTNAVVLVEGARHENPAARPGRFVCLAVSDTGCGMDESTMHRVFEPFFTTKEVGKGTGLGLATVHGIVAQHRGWVNVESRPREGSTFSVYLPALDSSTHAGGQETTNPASTLAALQGEETILLVEDEGAVRRHLGQFLRRLGYQVLEAQNGREALAVWERERSRIALLLSDMVMPGSISGLDLALRFRSEQPGLKLIISSGYSAEMSTQAMTSLPGLVFLPKPYEPMALAKTLRSCLASGENPG